MIDLAGILVGPIAQLLDKVIPDKDQREKLAHEIATLAERQSHEITLKQIEVNKTEAAHKSIFVAGWRPAIGWICGLGLANNYLVMPYVSGAAQMDIVHLMGLLTGLLGLGTLRTYEKKHGVARNS